MIAVSACDDPLSHDLAPTVRRELRPGDLGAIIQAHGEIYSREHGLDATFEAHVAQSVAAAGARGWPGRREGVWIVEIDAEHAGSLALTEEPDGSAALRWFLLDPRLRGAGLGRRLLGELLALARDNGFETVGLETFSDLRAAAHLYGEHGFRLIREESAPKWGRERLGYRRYETTFQRCAQTLSSARAGSSASPFSVSA